LKFTSLIKLTRAVEFFVCIKNEVFAAISSNLLTIIMESQGDHLSTCRRSSVSNSVVTLNCSKSIYAYIGRIIIYSASEEISSSLRSKSATTHVQSLPPTRQANTFHYYQNPIFLLNHHHSQLLERYANILPLLQYQGFQ